MAELLIELMGLDEGASVEQIEAAIAAVGNRYGGQRDGRVRLDEWRGGNEKQ